MSTETATLTYDLTDPDAREAFETALRGADYKQVVWEIDQHLRGLIKYGNYPEEIEATYQEIRSRLHELLEQWEVRI